ncbi:MAG: vWA domain-containing protein [Isosphaeraceae bacterium]
MDLQAPSSSASLSEDAYALADDRPAPPAALEGPHEPPHPALSGPADHAALAPPAPVPAPAANANGAAPAPASAGTTAAPPAAAAANGAEKAKADAARGVSLKRKKRRASPKHVIPAWAVSLLVHLSVLAGLAVVTFTSEGKKILRDINSALVNGPQQGEEDATPIYADPSNVRTDSAVGNEHADPGGGGGGGGGGFGGIGTGPPSATPVVAGVGSGVGEKTSLPGVKVVANVSGLSLMPSAPSMDLGGGGGIKGEVTFGVTGVGEALDQIAREILRHLQDHKVTVVWLFDESESMKDDQKSIREKFDRVATELKLNVADDKKAAGALNHAIVGFGEDIHYELEKPTLDIDQIGKAIDRLKVDSSGTENTLHALAEVINHYGGLIRKDRRLLIVLVTDESGDDGGYVEEARQLAVGKRVPIYVVGRQSLFGYERAHLRYVDPVTKDVYWPAIRRGPETADVELLQWDGLHVRWDEQPSGFPPYELARMAKDTGGIYFLLPSEENMRVRQREKKYHMSELKEYVPDYANRVAYMADREKSDFRRTLYDVIRTTREFPYRQHFPIDPAQMIPMANEAGAVATERLKVLLQIQERLESLRKLREREPEKRWQAHYDLMLAQIVVAQIKSYEYRACMAEMVRNPPRPSVMPTPERIVEWDVHHSKDRKAPKDETQKKYAEATKLLQEVIAKHPRTPWADLAQDEFDRGLGVTRTEWHHNPKYDERAKLVPKY